MAILYKVQTGAFKSSVRAAASATLVKAAIKKYLKKSGSMEDVSIAVIYSDGYYKVQEGAFSSKENAIRRRDLVRAAGVYAVVIETKTQDPEPVVPVKGDYTPRIRVIPIWFFEKDEGQYGDCTAILE